MLGVAVFREAVLKISKGGGKKIFVDLFKKILFTLIGARDEFDTPAVLKSLGEKK